MAYLCVSRATMAHVHAGGTTMALDWRHGWAVPRWRSAPKIVSRRRTHSTTAPRWYPAREPAREGGAWVSLGGWGALGGWQGWALG